MWDILLDSEESAKRLAGSILKTKMVRMQTEYMGTWKTKTALNGVPIDISDDDLVDFSSSRDLSGYLTCHKQDGHS